MTLLDITMPVGAGKGALATASCTTALAVTNFLSQLVALLNVASSSFTTAPRPIAPTVQATTVQVTPSETTLPLDVASDMPSDTLDTSSTADEAASVDATVADTAAPTKPRQVSPANGAVIDASRIYLRWTKSKDGAGAVKYAFEIQNRLSNGTYGNAQVIRGLKTNAYSARVLTVRRRWRVWSVDSAGNASAKSVWWTYIRKPLPAPKPSTPTTGTN